MTKRLICICLVAVLLLVSACNTAPAAPSTSGGIPNGTYEGVGTGKGGDITAEVTFAGGEITGVVVKSHNETPGYGDAMDTMIEKVVAKNSLDVDAVSGCTLSSNGILEAIKAAIATAGATPDMLVAKNTGEEPVVLKDEEYDVVVVGGGVAGMMAEIELAKNPEISSVLLEKTGILGGSIVGAGGDMWGFGSSYDDKYHMSAKKSDALAYFSSLANGDIRKGLLEKVFDISGETLDELIERGIAFNPEINKKATQYVEGWSVMRPTGNGHELTQGFVKILNDLKAEIRMDSNVTELLVDNGAVTGVKVETPQGSYTIKAKKVILATGGFSLNKDMMQAYLPEYANNLMMTGVGATGDGFALTQQFGTPIVGKGMMGYTRIDTKHADFDRISTFIVNKQGKRFMDENLHNYEQHALISKHADSHAIGIIDSNYSDVAALEKAVTDGYVKKFDTLEGVAQAYGIDAQNLKATAEAYGKAYAEGKDAEFGLKHENMLSMEKAPFYAFDCKATALGTIPGLKVTDDAQVVNGEDAVVANLYAVGELIMGNGFSTRYPASGTGISYSAYTGKIAALHAMENLEK